MRAIREVFQGCLVLAFIGVVMIVFVAAGSGASKPTPTPTPAPGNDTAATVAVVVEGYRPLVESSARAVDTMSEASSRDTETVHPSPDPSFAEQWGNVLGAICIVGMIVGAVVVVAVAWLVIKSGLALRLVQALERRG